MKKVLIILIMMLVFFSGCSSVGRKAGVVTKLNTQDEIQIKVLRTVKYTNEWWVSHEGGLEIEIINNTSVVQYINWSSSSISYNNFTSRVVTGNDRMVNVNSVVPNTAVLPNAKNRVIIIAADAVNVKVYPAVTYINVDPYMDNSKEVNLIISYTDSNTTTLKQAIFKINL